MDDEDEFSAQSLETLVIKDREYHSKKRKKILCIFIITLIVIIIITITVILIIIFYKSKSEKSGGKIICKYKTIEPNVKALLINLKDNIEYNLTIDNKDYEPNKYHSFKKVGLHTVIFNFKKNLDSLENLFAHIDNLIEVDFSNLDIENIETMSSIFNSCGSLSKVNFDNKTPNLKNMSYMFYKCNKLTQVNLNLNTSNVIAMDYMFFGCGIIEHIDISNFQLERLINSENMFTTCQKLTEIKFNENTKTENLEKMSSMFQDCSVLKYINTKIFRTLKVTDLNNVFQGCHTLNELNLSNFETKNIKELIQTFQSCDNLVNLELSNFDTSEVISME